MIQVMPNNLVCIIAGKTHQTDIFISRNLRTSKDIIPIKEIQ